MTFNYLKSIILRNGVVLTFIYPYCVCVNIVLNTVLVILFNETISVIWLILQLLYEDLCFIFIVLIYQLRWMFRLIILYSTLNILLVIALFKINIWGHPLLSSFSQAYNRTLFWPPPLKVYKCKCWESWQCFTVAMFRNNASFWWITSIQANISSTIFFSFWRFLPLPCVRMSERASDEWALRFCHYFSTYKNRTFKSYPLPPSVWFVRLWKWW